jgi:hypothetical protein
VSTSFDRAQITAWLTAFSAESVAAPTPIEPTVSELLEIHGLLGDIYRALVWRPDRHAEIQHVVDRLMGRRQALLAELCEQLVTWVAAGGRVEMLGGESGAAALAAGQRDPTSGATPPAGQLPQTSASGAFECAPPAAPYLPSPRRQVVDAQGEAPVATAVFVHPAQLNDTTHAAEPWRRPASPDEPLGDHGKLLLQRALAPAGPPRSLDTASAIADELDALEACSLTMTTWPLLPRPVQRLLLALLVARLRAAKDVGGLSPELRGQIRELLARCPTYAKANPLGAHVNGLQVAHLPLGSSWTTDAIDYWDMLAKAGR